MNTTNIKKSIKIKYLEFQSLKVPAHYVVTINLIYEVFQTNLENRLDLQGSFQKFINEKSFHLTRIMKVYF